MDKSHFSYYYYNYVRVTANLWQIQVEDVMIYQGLSDDFLKTLIKEALKTSKPGPWHITRHFMYNKLHGILKDHDGPQKKCIAISHSTQFAKVLGLEDTVITEANYPEYNMISLEIPSESYDFCVSDQTLEHIEGDPFIAFEESVRVVKKGGIIVHTTCFINHVHGVPKDFWRFTPDALRLLSKHFNTKVIECGGWGNREVWTYLSLGFRMAKVPSDVSHPIYNLAMKNDESIPIVTWVVSQKI